MAKATTIKEALARWEEKSGQKASEAKEVKLYGQVPPVEKMDGALSALVNCESVFGVYQLNGKFMIHSKIYEKKRRFEQDFQKEINIHAFDKARHQKIIQYVMKLSLSTNCIDRIANLNNLKNLRILSLGRNNIKNLNGLEAVAETLEELWISYNLIEKLRGIRVMKKLKVLYMSNNLVKDWAEFVRLAEVPALEELVFVGNPLQEKFATDQSSWIEEATKRVPKLKKLDGTLVVKGGEEEEGAEGAEGTEGAEGGN